MLRASCLTGRLSRRGQHILQEDTVSLRRVCHQHMSHGSHQPSVLQNGAAAHPLHDASSGLPVSYTHLLRHVELVMSHGQLHRAPQVKHRKNVEAELDRFL